MVNGNDLTVNKRCGIQRNSYYINTQKNVVDRDLIKSQISAINIKSRAAFDPFKEKEVVIFWFQQH